MKYLIGLIAAFVLVGAGMYYTNNRAPAGAAGINGSANQGNLGQPDSGEVQTPQAGSLDTYLGENLVLSVASGHLTAFNGMTLYTFSKDTAASSTCYAKCVLTWAPYSVGTDDDMTRVQGAVRGTVAKMMRADGILQVTYNGKPLYFYKDDKKQGDAHGDKVNDVWFVATP